jgi:acetyltransferase-like isoleucine patch superfamily enzyme
MRRSSGFAPWHVLVNVLAASALVPRRARRFLYRVAGIEVGPANLRPGIFFLSANVRIGEYAFLNRGVWFHGASCISIGARTAIGTDVHLTCVSHELGGSHRRAGALVERPITIGDGCWIGSRSTILGGVTIGDGCVVAAGAVVTTDCDADALYAGVPAVKKRDLASSRCGADAGE